MTIHTFYNSGDRVCHRADLKGEIGIVTAFLLRGRNHSYEVCWPDKEAKWHLEFELVAADPVREAGFGGNGDGIGTPNVGRMAAEALFREQKRNQQPA